MINNLKEILDIINKLDKVTIEQLDKAIKKADKDFRIKE